MTFQRKFAVIGILVLIGFATMFWTSQSIISKFMVNGPIYNLLARDKDIISDILPPNEFIVEPYLVVCQINGAKSPAVVKKHSRELQDLETKFRDSHAVWSEKLLLNASGTEGVLAHELLQNAYGSADSFLKLFMVSGRVQLRTRTIRLQIKSLLSN